MTAGRPPKYTSVEEVQSIIEKYFESSAWVQVGESKEFRPTMAGLARALKLSRQGLLNYSKKDEFFDTIKEARDRVEEALEQRLYGNSVTGIIFNLKNNFSWQDRIDQNHTSNDGSMTPVTKHVYKIVRPKDREEQDK